MMTCRNIFILLSLFVSDLVLAQMPGSYNEHTSKAMAAYEEGRFEDCAAHFSRAFEANDDKGYVNDRYNAACCFARAGNTEQAYHNLFRIAERGGYKNYSHISQDQDLLSLHEDDRWEILLGVVRANKERAEANLNKPLAALLDSIYEDDQNYRHAVNDAIDQYGHESEAVQTIWKKIIELDSINQIKVTAILDEYGWLGPDVVGDRGNTALFLVIQHADIETQKKYLPMMREAVEKGNALGSSLALLEDRVALRQGKRQIYGSQIGRNPATNEYYVMPLEEPELVDERRAAVGLGLLSDYVGNWGIQWDPDTYKKQLPEIEALEKSKKENSDH